MPIPRTLKEAIYDTIHRNPKDIKEIAEDVGCSASTLYRYCNDEETTSFAEFPLRKLLPILNSTNNDQILDYLEARRGRIAFRVPKVKASKVEEGELVDQYQAVTIQAVSALRKFLSTPTQKNFEKVEEALLQVMQSSACVKKYCDKKAAGQLEMDL